jgi:hypothetical protein
MLPHFDTTRRAYPSQQEVGTVLMDVPLDDRQCLAAT